MEEKNHPISLNGEAMRCGTLLGLLWIAMYASILAGFGNIIFALLFLALYCASPIYAGYLAIRTRKRELNNIMPFFQAWMFLLIMYICASLLSAVAQFIYFRFLDDGYIMQMMQQAATIMANNPEIFDTMAKDFNAAIQEYQNLDTRHIVFSMLSSNIMNGTILAPIIALFVKRNPK